MDTAQPSAAENSVASSDPFADAATAFKVSLGQAPEPQPRNDRGQFASPTAAEIEAEEAEAPLGEEAEAESYDEADDAEAADEAQPEALDMPHSWPAEQAETWKTLPAEAQALIAEREAQRDAAVNAKFQEAANVRKANEALITEAQTNRQRFAEAADMVLSLVQPQRPSLTMLDPNSGDYNPDAYHLAHAQFEQTAQILQSVQQQRAQAVAQQQADEEAAERSFLMEIEAKTRPALLKDVPDLGDAQKQPQAITQLVQYAVAQGIPEFVFTDPDMAKGVTSAQLHLVWKAQQYDRMKQAQATVQPKAARPAAPPVRPGVATSRSAVKAAQRKQNFDRLTRDGSIEAGAAIFKSFLKG